jgi:hypothetical protein
MRAPLFYDSNDTGYYVDPASTTQLNAARFAGGGYTRTYSFTPAGTKGSGYVWVRASMGGFNGGGDTVRFTVTRSIGDNGNDPYGGCTADFTAHSREWHSGQETCTVFYTQHGGAPYGQYITNAGPRDLAGGGYWFYMRVLQGVTYRVYVHAESGAMGDFDPASQSDPGSVPAVYTGFNILGSGGNSADFVAQNISYGLSSVRAPIFYDNDNTGYYLDPASTSYVQALQTNGNLTVGNSTSSNIYMTDTDETTRIIHCNTNRIGFLNSGGAWSSYSDNTGNWITDYIGYAGQSFRAPIFYDSNDTGYYTDPNDRSLTNEMCANKMRADTNRNYADNQGWWAHDPYGYGWGKPHGSFRTLEVSSSGDFSNEPAMFRIHQWGSGSAEFWKPKGTIMYLRETPGGSSTWFTNFQVTVRTDVPILYDYDNTAFYSDPNGVSRLVAIDTVGGTYNTFRTWTDLPGYHGFYSSVHNSAHFYPNNGSYGSWRIDGSRDGWRGLNFDNAVVLMMNDNETGHHRNGYGWQWRWYNGTMYVYKNAQGGGTGATVWDSSNAPRASNSNLMYYQGFTLDANTMDTNATGFTYSVNAPYTGPIVRFSTGSGAGYDLWLNAPYSGGGNALAFRTRNGDTGSLNSWYYLAAYNSGALNAVAFYDQDDTGYYCDPNATSILNNLTVNGTLNAYSNAIVVNRINFRDTSGSADSDPYCLRWMDESANGGLSWLELQMNDDYNEEFRIYGNSCAGYGCGQISGNLYHRFRADGWAWHSDYVEGGSSVRGPIFYDSNDTGYYLDPNSTGLSQKIAGNFECYARSAAWAEGIRVRVPSRSTWGGIRFTRDEGNYNGNWAIGYTGIDASDDLTFWGNLSGTENMRARLTHNADLTVLGTVRSPIFYDSNDTGYYTDPNNTSRLNVVTSNNINNYGVISTGQSGQDSGISRSSYPYSFGFQQAGAWTGPYPDLVLQYHTGVTIAGNANYDGISFKADHGDDTVIFRVNGGSNYLYKYYWMYTNTTGYYSDTNNWHIEPNSSSSYGGTMIRGTRNGWRGIHFYEGGNVPHMMFDGSANGGVYFETGGRWASYYSYDNNCWGFGTSTTNSAFNIYCPTGVYSGGRVDGTVFYDANNTGYYVDPASTSYLNFINIQSGFANGPVSFLSTVGATSGSLSNPSLQAYSLSNNSAFMSFHKAGHYAVNFGLDSDNVLRIGGWSASANRWQLDMSGNMTAAGNVTAYSDIRLKDNIEPIENALDKVTQLNGVTFTRKDHDDKTRRHAGVIAQEVEKVLPEVVSEDNEGIKNVAYGNMVGLLIEAIKEQNKAIYDLKKEVERLKSKLGE